MKLKSNNFTKKENGNSKQCEENIVSGAKTKVSRVLYFQ
jgi:hypothetical protein